MDDWLGKLKQAVLPPPVGPDQPKVSTTPIDPSVSRIDLKSASHREVVDFVKRQNKHIRQLETLLEKYEAKHADYKQQIREYTDQVQSLRSLEHVQGDEALKERIQALLVERDALAAEMQVLTEAHQHEAEDKAKKAEQAKTGIEEAEYSRVKTALERTEAKLADLEAERGEQESTLLNTIELQKNELKELSGQITALKSQLEAANKVLEVLKARLSSSATEHTSLVQRLNSEYQQQMVELNSKISNLEEALIKASLEAEARLQASSSIDSSQTVPSISVSEQKTSIVAESITEGDNAAPEVQKTVESSSQSDSSTTLDTTSDSMTLVASLTSERDSLKSQLDTMKAEVEDLNIQLKSAVASVSSTPSASSSSSPAPVSTDPQTSQLSDPLSSPFYAELTKKSSQLAELDEKLKSKQQLLIKAHKHLGDMTTQLADAKVRAEQLLKERDTMSIELESRRARMEQTSASSAELKATIAQLEESLKESQQEFKEYKLKVALQESQKESVVPTESEALSTTAEIPEVLQEKLRHLKERVEVLQLANDELVVSNQASLASFNEMRSKHDSLATQLRHIKERDVSRSSVSEKHQTELQSVEKRYEARISELAAEHQASTTALNQQLIKLRRQADESIQQKNTEISTLKDMVEVLKVQVASWESGRAGPSKVIEQSSEPTKRIAARVDSNSPSKRRIRPESAHERSGSTDFGASSSLAGPVLTRGSHDASTSIHAEDQPSQVQQLLGRLKSLQDQVGELEQLLALSREQEQFLKLELRRSDRSSAPSSSGQWSASSYQQPGGLNANDYVLLRNVIKTMLETRQVPSLAVFSDLLKLSPEEIDHINQKAQSRNGPLSGVSDPLSALWNVFSSPQR